MKMGRDIGKISAVAGTCDGFAANRSRAPFITEMMLMLEEGALPEQIDKVMVDFGYPMGPFAVSDLSGLDISYDTRKRRAAADPNYRKLHVPDRLVEMGRKGQKTGAGWYRYEKGDRTPHPDEVVKSVIADVAQRIRHRAAHLHRRGDPAPAPARVGERGVQDPGRGQGLPRERHRRDVAARLRLPALSRRADVLGRHGGREGDTRADQRMAPALRRALEAERSAARRSRRAAATCARQRQSFVSSVA